MNPTVMNPYQNHYQYTQPTNGITWVQGIEGAKAFQMTPNSNAVLLDSDTDGIFYIKVSDNIGMCSLRIFKYEEIQQGSNNNSVDLSNYVTKDELGELIDKRVKERLNEKSTISTVKSSGKLITE